MEEILKQIAQLENKIEDYDKDVVKLMNIQSNEIPANVFPMIFNKLRLGRELLSYYGRKWKEVFGRNCKRNSA